MFGTTLISGCSLTSEWTVTKQDLAKQSGAVQQQIKNTWDEDLEVTETENIEDIQNQVTRIIRVFEKDWRRFWEFDYLTPPTDEYIESNCGWTPSWCWGNQNTKTRIIQIDTNRKFAYYDPSIGVYQSGVIQLNYVSFLKRYENEHPYCGAQPKEWKFCTHLITINDWKVVEITEAYTS
jgi:hypothetical protein